MCREQLGKLTAEGAAVLGISHDTPQEAARLARDLGLPFRILSDPAMEVIRAYRMKAEGMEMADMGYVVIDKQGRIRARGCSCAFGSSLDDTTVVRWC